MSLTVSRWRFCVRCHSMFHDGSTDKGACGAGGGHSAKDGVYLLPHDVFGRPHTQDQRRYCNNCHGMFYDGYPAKGACPSGGGHAAIGYHFVLPVMRHGQD